jgi:redox-sensitive bicupin YhaK (pirin superfamily)
MANLTSTVQVRRAADRYETQLAWLRAQGLFPLGRQDTADAAAFGLLFAHQDDRVAPKAGFPTHPHRDIEVVTWVISGAVEHRDSTGGAGVLRRGHAQHMTAGRGVEHSEMNPSDVEWSRSLQMWIAPDERGAEPRYDDIDVDRVLDAGGLVPVVSGRERDAAAPLRQRDATLWAARPREGTTLRLPDAPYLHLYIAVGSLDLEGEGTLFEGDSVRMTAPGARRVTVDEGPVELLAWEMHSALATASRN